MIWGKTSTSPASTKYVTTLDKHQRQLEQIATLKLGSTAAFEALKESRKEVGRLRAKLFTLEKTILKLEFPPRWVPDNARDACAACDSPFSWSNRRHHCRACGEIFDDECTQNRSCLPRWGFSEPVRVCDTCYDQILLVPTSTFGQLSEASVACDELAAQVLGLGGLGHEMPSPVKPAAREQEEQASAILQVAEASKSSPPKGPKRSEIPFPPPIPEHLLRKALAPVPVALLATNNKERRPLRVIQGDNGPRLNLDEIANGRTRLKPVSSRSSKPSKPSLRTPSPIRSGDRQDILSELKQSMSKRREQVRGGSPSLLLDETDTMILENIENASPNRQRSKRRAAKRAAKETEKLMPPKGSNDVANALWGPPVLNLQPSGGSSEASWLG